MSSPWPPSHHSGAGAAGFAGGDGRVSPRVFPPHGQGLYICVLSIFVEHTHTHTQGAFTFVHARRRWASNHGRRQKNQKVRHRTSLLPPFPPDFAKQGEGDKKKTPRRHTHTHAVIPIIHVNEPLVDTARVSSRIQSTTQGVCRRSRTHPPHTHTSEAFLPKNKAKRFGFFPNPPDSCVVLTWW